MTAHLINGKEVNSLDSAVYELIAHACIDLGFTDLTIMTDYEKGLVIGVAVDLGVMHFRSAVKEICMSLNMSKSAVYANIKRHYNLHHQRKRKDSPWTLTK